MNERYDIMTYNGTFAEVAKHDSEGNLRFQRIFYSGLSRRTLDGTMAVEDIGTEPMQMNNLYFESIRGTTAADDHYRSGVPLDKIAADNPDTLHPNSMQNPFGLTSPEDVKQYIEYSETLSGLYDAIRDPDQHSEQMRTKTRRDMKIILEMIDESPFPKHDPQMVIDILELELEFSEILATDYGLREEVLEKIAKLEAIVAEMTTSES